MESITNNLNKTIFVDLDLTLIKRISTHEYLNVMIPNQVAALLYKAIYKIRPWRISSDNHAEWYLVVILTMLMPWNYFLWKKTAVAFAHEHKNVELLNHLEKQDGRVVIATRGFDFIVKPIIELLGFSEFVACRTTKFGGERKLTKYEQLKNSKYADQIDDSIVVTDSTDDQQLLDNCSVPLLIEWPGAKGVDLYGGVNVTLQYMHRTKTPKGKFIKYGWVMDDLFAIIIAFSLLGDKLVFPSVIFQVTALIIFSFAFWMVYEIGYHENDVQGEKLEADPFLPDNYAENKGTVNEVNSWVWALALTVLASLIFSFSASELSVPMILIRLILLLAVTRTIFGFFNRIPKVIRPFPHLVLQFLKFFGFVVVSPLSLIGVAICFAQAMYRWLPYCFYRWTDREEYMEPITFTRFAIYFVGVTIAVLSGLDIKLAIIIQIIFAFIFFAKRSSRTMRNVKANIGSRKTNDEKINS